MFGLGMSTKGIHHIESTLTMKKIDWSKAGEIMSDYIVIAFEFGGEEVDGFISVYYDDSYERVFLDDGTCTDVLSGSDGAELEWRIELRNGCEPNLIATENGEDIFVGIIYKREFPTLEEI